MRQLHFEVNDAEYQMAQELKNKLHKSISDILRELLKTKYKKEILTVSKILCIIALCIAATSCGGQNRPLPISDPPAPRPTPTPAATPTPSPTPTPIPTPTPVIQSAVPIVCTNTLPTDPGGQICTQGDVNSPNFYEQWQWQIADRGDGHGTFSALTETGIKTGSTYEIVLNFPHPVNISEVHGTLNILSFCGLNGFATFWNGALNGGPLEQIVSAKTASLNAGDEPNFSYPQIVFPQSVPVSQLFLFVNNDLCAVSTVSWTLNGSY